jgi:sugar phosphate isomerase/epimerase
MYLSVATVVYQWAGMPLYHAMDRIADIGLHHVDVLSYKRWQPANEPVSNQLKLAKRMEQLDIKGSSVIMLPDYQLGTSKKDEQEHNFAQLKRAGNFIRRIGGKQVLICKAEGLRQFDMKPEDIKKNAVEMINRYGEWCEKNDVIITFEIEPPYIDMLNSAGEMKWLIDQIKTTKAYCNVDIGHFTLLLEGPEKLDMLKDDVLHVHLSDNDGYSTEVDCLLGEGKVDFKGYLDKLFALGIEENCKKAGVDCCCSIEVAEGGNVIEHPDDMVLKSYNYMLRNYPYFRGPDNQ